MQRIAQFLIPVMLAGSGCKQEPQVGGVSLECSTDTQCADIGENWRCFSSVCIRNAPPTLAPIETVFVQPGTPVVVTATYTDEEEDGATVAWTAVNGPARELLDPDTYVGDTLEVEPLAEGVYRFEVIATDDYSAGPVEPFVIVAQQSVDAVYVSTLGDDSSACGTFERPCVSVGVGVARLAERGGASVLVAAQAGSQPYAECLDIAGTTTILGCFDPLTWERDLTLRPLCRIECDDAGGHRIGGTAQVEQLTLAMQTGVQPPTDGSPPHDLPLVTAAVRDGDPTLELVHVEAAACGTGCGVVGLATLNGRPTLRGVDVSAAVSDFEPVRFFAGMLLVGGAPVVEGLAAADSPDNEAHGNIQLNVPATETAGGILVRESAASISRMEINGGPATELFGVVVFDSAISVAKSEIELTGFGTREVFGVLVGTCADATDDLCQCETWLTAVECSDIQVDQPPSPSLTMDNNEVRLGGVSTDPALAPCRAAGLLLDSSVMQTEVTDNSVVLGHDMPLSIGVAVQGREGAADPSLVHAISGNTVTVGDSRVRGVCVAGAGSEVLDSLNVGLFGLVASGTANVTIADNEVTTGANDWLSVGMAFFENATTTVEGNTVTAGNSSTGVRAQTAIGALLGSTTTDQMSVFSRNDVRIADPQLGSDGLPIGGAHASQALSVQLEKDPSGGLFPYWDVRNNFVYAGAVEYGTGLAFTTAFVDPARPVFTHNTISGGGHPTWGATSKAVVYYSAGNVQHESAVLKNNLLDAGDAQGIRHLLFNIGSGFFTTSGGETEGNVGQLVGDIAGPLPTLAIPAQRATLSNPLQTPGTTSWYVLLAGAGSVLKVEEGTGSIGATVAGETLGRPAVNQLGKPVAWLGFADGVDTAAVAVPHAISIGRLAGDDLEFYPYSTDSERDVDGTVEPVHHYPCAILLENVATGTPEDILFAQSSSCAPPGVTADPGLYVMRGRLLGEGGGYDPPEAYSDLTLRDPSLIATLGQRGTIVVVDGTSLAATGPDGDETETLAGATRIEQLLVTDIDTSTGSDLAWAHNDVVVVTDSDARVFMNVSSLADLSGNGIDFVGGEPCSSIGVLLAAVGDLVPSQSNAELIFACKNGDWDLFSYVATTGLVRMATPDNSGDPICGLTVGDPLRSGSDNDGKLLVARLGSEHSIEECKMTLDGTGTLWVCESIGSFQILKNVAMNATYPVDDFPPSVPGIIRKTDADPDWCPLQYRDGDLTPYDLHLASGTNACVDVSGLTILTEDDIDGCGARDASVSDPDIGADELGETGVACSDGT